MNRTTTCDCHVIHEEVVNKAQQSMPPTLHSLASMYKLFADDTRVKILWALCQNDMCVCDLAVLLDMTKSAVSHQLKNLRLANLVKFKRQGQIVYYSIADEHVICILSVGLEHIKSRNRR